MPRDLVRLEMLGILEPEKSVREKIDPQSIEELAASLKKLGQLQPILVRQEGTLYRIEAGHRRFLAAFSLGWSVIDAIILEPTDEDTLHLERAHENLIRSDLNPVEESKIVWDLVYEDGRGVERTAKLLCKPESWVDSRLVIAKLPEDLKAAIRNREISVAVAKTLNKEKNHETRGRLLKGAIEYGASAAVVDRWINDSQVGIFLENKDVEGLMGDIQAVGLTETTMPCRVCNTSHTFDVLRHIWICPDCMGAMRELASEVQKIAGEREAVGEQQ